MGNDFETIGKIIEKILKNYGIEKKVKENQVINIWDEIVGRKISSITKPMRVADGKLFVQVCNSSWRSELFLLKPKILKKIQKEIGKGIIQEIIFV